MGITKALLRIAPLDPAKGWSADIEAIVDTGATYTKVPRTTLADLGIEPVAKRKVRLANAEMIERDAAPVRILLQGEVGVSVVTFGEAGEDPLLGAVTLEEFGVAVDPGSKRLVPAELYEL